MNRWTSVFLLSALSIASCSIASGQQEVKHVFPVILKDALAPTAKLETVAKKLRPGEARAAVRQSSRSSLDAMPQMGSQKTERSDRPLNTEPETELSSKTTARPTKISPKSKALIEPPSRGIPGNNVYKSPRATPPELARLPSPMVPQPIKSSSSGFNFSDAADAQQFSLQNKIRVANSQANDLMNFRPSKPAATLPTSQAPTPTPEPKPTPIAEPSRQVKPASSVIRPSINFSDETAPFGLKPGVSILNRPQQVAAPQVTLQSKVLGPESMTANQPDEFEVVITNSSKAPAKDVIVRLSVPSDITITHLDRDAILDHTNRSILWQLQQIPAGKSERIRYQAISSTPGSHLQVLALGVNNAFQGKTPFRTKVLTQTKAASQIAEANLNQRR